VISAILLIEVLMRGTIIYLSIVAVVIMFIVNIIDTRKLLKLANQMDVVEVNKKIHEKAL
jgi:cell division protein FtsL